MTTASNNEYPSLLVKETAAASVGTPAAGDQRLFIDTDHALKLKNSAGTVTRVGLTFPSILQYIQSTTAATSVVLSAAPTTGHSLLLISDATTGQITSVTSTNTTWTQVKTFASGGGSFFALWVGVVSGTGGTTVSWTKPGSFCTVGIMEVTDTLTPTAVQTTSANNGTALQLTSVITGHLVVFAAGTDNTAATCTATFVNHITLGTGTNFTSISVAYATSSTVLGTVGGSAGGGVMVEVT